MLLLLLERSGHDVAVGGVVRLGWEKGGLGKSVHGEIVRDLQHGC